MMLPREKYDEAFRQRKESIQRELLDKLRQFIDVGEV